MAAVRQDGMALEFVHETLKMDEEIAFEAVNQDGAAVQFLPKRMLSHLRIKQTVLTAIQDDGLIIR